MPKLITVCCPSCGSDQMATDETLLGTCGLSGFYVDDGKLRHKHDDQGTEVAWDTSETNAAHPYICTDCGTHYTAAEIARLLPADVRAEITEPLDTPPPDRLQVLAGLLADLAKHSGAIERKQRKAGPVEPEDWHKLRVLVRQAEILNDGNAPAGFVLIDRETLGALCEASAAAATLKAEDEETARNDGEPDAAEQYAAEAFTWGAACDKGRAILASGGALPLVVPELLDEGALCAELADYCKAQGLPHLSADELAASDYPNDEQREWLRDFCARWDRWEDQQSTAAAAVGAVADAEGWGLFNGDAELQRDDEADTFASDDDARAYVEHMAAAGSPVHAAALRRLASAPERQRLAAEAITRRAAS